MRPAFLEGALRRALDEPGLRVLDVEPVTGGCIHEAARLSTTSGEVFAKWSGRCAADLFPCEAAGLEALRGAGSEIVVPRVLAASAPQDGDPGFLVLEYLAPARKAGPEADERLGRGLAAIHARTAARFGFPHPSYCGATPQDNRECGSWISFYGEQRLRPLLRALEREGRLAPDDRRLHERVIERLPSILPFTSTPALVHGDLWSGNVLATERGPALVDPACAFADREMELGITTLFGGLSPRAMAAYEEASPLPAGWRERNGVYQLYHLLNHALLFGGHYADAARRTARVYAG